MGDQLAQLLARHYVVAAPGASEEHARRHLRQVLDRARTADRAADVEAGQLVQGVDGVVLHLVTDALVEVRRDGAWEFTQEARSQANSAKSQRVQVHGLF